MNNTNLNPNSQNNLKCVFDCGKSFNNNAELESHYQSMGCYVQRNQGTFTNQVSTHSNNDGTSSYSLQQEVNQQISSELMVEQRKNIPIIMGPYRFRALHQNIHSTNKVRCSITTIREAEAQFLYRIESVEEFLEKLRLIGINKDSVFLDCSSYRGQLVFSAALLLKCKAVGYEKVAKIYDETYHRLISYQHSYKQDDAMTSCFARIIITNTNVCHGFPFLPTQLGPPTCVFFDNSDLRFDINFAFMEFVLNSPTIDIFIWATSESKSKKMFDLKNFKQVDSIDMSYLKSEQSKRFEIYKRKPSRINSRQQGILNQQRNLIQQQGLLPDLIQRVNTAMQRRRPLHQPLFVNHLLQSNLTADTDVSNNPSPVLNQIQIRGVNQSQSQQNQMQQTSAQQPLVFNYALSNQEIQSQQHHFDNTKAIRVLQRIKNDYTQREQLARLGLQKLQSRNLAMYLEMPKLQTYENLNFTDNEIIEFLNFVKDDVFRLADRSYQEQLLVAFGFMKRMYVFRSEVLKQIEKELDKVNSLQHQIAKYENEMNHQTTIELLRCGLKIIEQIYTGERSKIFVCVPISKESATALGIGEKRFSVKVPSGNDQCNTEVEIAKLENLHDGTPIESQFIVECIAQFTYFNKKAFLYHHYFRNLSQGLKVDNLTSQQINFTSFCLLTAIAHAHRHHINHMNLSLKKVLVDLKYVPKISGWGSSRNIMYGGTFGYQAPELFQAVHGSVPSEKDMQSIDAYALGVMLYKMKYKKKPFSKEEIIEMQKTGIRPNLPYQIEIPLTDLDFIIKGLLDFNPRSRWTPEHALNQRLFTNIKKRFYEEQNFNLMYTYE